MKRPTAVTESEFKSRLAACGNLLSLLQLLFEALLAGTDVDLSERGIAQVFSTPYPTDLDAIRGRGLLRKVTRLLAAAALPEEPAPVLLAPEVWARLKAHAGQALPSLGPRMVARELLTALDTTVRSNLLNLFEAEEGQKLLESGDFFPIGARDLKAFFAPKGVETPAAEKPSFAAGASRQNRPGPGKLTHLGVLPELGFKSEVTFNFGAGAALSRFVQKPVVGVLLPNTQLDREFELSCSPDRGVFFGVRPRDIFGQEKRILELLHQAEAAGVSVALLPELSVTRELSMALGTWLTGPERKLSLMVAGSFHHTEGGRQFNRSQTFHAGLPAPLEHDKFNPFELAEWGDETFEPALLEHLLDKGEEDLAQAPLRLTVHWSRTWSFTTLICKDFLDRDAHYLLQLLRPNFAFVVSLSPKTALFETGALHLAGAAQTVTLMANFPGAPKEPGKTALAVFPLVKDDQLATHSALGTGFPGLLVFNIHQRALGWQPAPPPTSQAPEGAM